MRKTGLQPILPAVQTEHTDDNSLRISRLRLLSLVITASYADPHKTSTKTLMGHHAGCVTRAGCGSPLCKVCGLATFPAKSPFRHRGTTYQEYLFHILQRTGPHAASAGGREDQLPQCEGVMLHQNPAKLREIPALVSYVYRATNPPTNPETLWLQDTLRVKTHTSSRTTSRGLHQ